MTSNRLLRRHGDRTSCYASRGTLTRSHTVHVAGVQDHCFGRTDAASSFNQRRARTVRKLTYTPPYTVVFSSATGGSNAISHSLSSILISTL